MVKVCQVSDVHLEFGHLEIKNTEGADILILGGDICVAKSFKYLDLDARHAQRGSLTKPAVGYLKFFKQAASEFKHVLYVLGNHEHYSGDIATTLDILRKALAEFPNIHILEKETFTYDDVTFVGATLWTDCDKGNPMAIMQIENTLSDFRVIVNSNRPVSRTVPLYDEDHNIIGHKAKVEPGRFSATDTIDVFTDTVAWLTETIAPHPDQKFVIMTHHGPSYQSVPKEFAGSIVNGGFYSSLDNFILDHPQIKVWTFGHTHFGHEYEIGSTRIVCNPRGYAGREPQAKTYVPKFFDV